MSGWGSSSEKSVGGRSPKAADGREQYRTSRRLGLTHSLTSPRPPDLPARPVPGAGDDLPRPRSVSPPRKPLPPPSVKGSVLSARLERAAVVRGVAEVNDGPPPIPAPVTRARFSVKLGEGAGTADGEGKCSGKRTGTGSPASKAGEAVVVEVEGESKGDETPVVILPSAVSEEEKKKVSIEEGGGGGGRGRRGRGGSASAVGGLGEPRSPGATSGGIAAVAAAEEGAATAAFGVGRSQIQASPQRWVPRRLSRSPVNMKKSGFVGTPPRSRPRW